MAEPRILYEDDDIVVLDKPAGLMVHEDGRSTDPTLADWLIEKFPGITEVGESIEMADGSRIPRPGIVHRLDKETSGVLVAAKTPRAFGSLKKQFQKREVRKTYRAFVYGLVTDDRGIIDKSVGRAQGSISRRSVRSPGGAVRDAVTAFRTIARGAKEPERNASYLEVFPKTGRTHQIRVHLASIAHPVVCDRLYAPRCKPLLGFTRVALHALELRITHPITTREMTFRAPLPQDFLEAEKELCYTPPTHESGE